MDEQRAHGKIQKPMECEEGIWLLGRNIRMLSGPTGMLQERLEPTWN